MFQKMRYNNLQDHAVCRIIFFIYSKQGDSKKQENKATQVISDEEQELLKKEDIQVVSDENGNIKLKNTSQNTINEANQILLKSKNFPKELYQNSFSNLFQLHASFQILHILLP